MESAILLKKKCIFAVFFLLIMSRSIHMSHSIHGNGWYIYPNLVDVFYFFNGECR